jgi:hypothetical protein
MYDNDIEDDRMRVMDYAICHKKGSKEEIELYERLSLALELKQNDSFRVEGSIICNGINFNIVTPYPDGLPVDIGTMFFNIDTNYSVSIQEDNLYTNGAHKDPGEMNFNVWIKKY